jgi:antimicrobial peptide system SdpB family protein
MREIINYLENNLIFNQKIILARCFLAFGALLILFFNNSYELSNIDIGLLADRIENNSSLDFSIFSFFSPPIAKTICIFILLFVFTGYLPQLSCFLQAWVHLSICNSFVIVEGGDQIASNLSLLLIPICLFDARINQWNKEKLNPSLYLKNRNVFFGVYYFLIRLQVAVIYLHSGVGKLYKEDWRDGTCLYYWLNNNIFGAPDFILKFLNLLTLSSFAPIISWSIIFLELGLFACILATNKRILMLFFFLGILFHFSIFILHGLISFMFPMIGALILYLDKNNYVFNYLKTLYYERR